MSTLFEQHVKSLAEGYRSNEASSYSHRTAFELLNQRAENAKAIGVIRELRQKLAIAGVEGSPPAGETTIGALYKRAHAAEELVRSLQDELHAATRQLADNNTQLNAGHARVTELEEEANRLDAECNVWKAERDAALANYAKVDSDRAKVIEANAKLHAESDAAHSKLKAVLDAVQELAKRHPYSAPDLDDVFRSAFAYLAAVNG